MHVSLRTVLILVISAAVAVATGCKRNAAPVEQATATTAVGPGASGSTDGPDDVAIERAGDAAASAGWTLVNPEALSRVPPARRPLAGLGPAEALDAIARDAGLRAQIHAGRVRFLRGAPYAAIDDRAEIDLLILDASAADILQHIATAGRTGLDVAPGVDLERRISMNLTRVPIRTVLTLVGDETGADITPHANGIRVRPRMQPAAGP
ncbi:hypothetical protein LDO31_16255 [Luteimonas sp. XNQY3]|nr:hypothetical protein [Luteimonas sp. XNQY3]